MKKLHELLNEKDAFIIKLKMHNTVDSLAAYLEDYKKLEEVQTQIDNYKNPTK